MSKSEKLNEGETAMQVLAFGYKCQECGQGTVRDRVFHDFPTKLKGYPLTVDEAHIGVCDRCGAQHFDPNETARWRTLLAEKQAESYLQPVDIRKLQSLLGLTREQFAILLGCTRQSLYNWGRPDRTAAQSRMADLFMRLIRESYAAGEINVLTFLIAEAEKLGFSLSVSPNFHAMADIIAYPRTVSAKSIPNKSTVPLRLAADSDAPDESVVLMTERDENIARLFYAYQDATLRLEFIHPVSFDEFDAVIYFKDGSQTTSHDVKIMECKAVLVRTNWTEEHVDRVVLSPKECSQQQTNEPETNSN